MKSEAVYVLLGRFSPIHKGHQMLINQMIKSFGEENCLILIGSSTSYNQRTPFNFAARKRMIKILYPKVKIYGIPDTKPAEEMFNYEYMQKWLMVIKKLERKLQKKFVFCGGEAKDIEYLKNIFETKVLINRVTTGENISATKIRKALIKKNNRLIEKLIDRKVIGLVVSEYLKFSKKTN